MRVESSACRAAQTDAFTLIELLVVMGIIAIIGAVTIPAMTYMTKSGKIEAGMNSISVAAASARAYAGRDRSGKFIDVYPDDTGDPPSLGDQEGTYSGVAMIFTPANEIRIVENVPNAVSTGGTHLELMGTPRSGYDDLEGRDYITIPSGSGVLGIVRVGSGDDEINLLAPPFAVRFNEHGHLIAATSIERSVYYDSNYNGQYTASGSSNGSSRDDPYGGGAPYVPGHFDPDSPDFKPVNWNATEQKYRLPFEKIETVVAVLVYSRVDFRDAGHDLTGEMTGSSVEGQWLLDNSQAIYFNRYSGLVIRDR